MGRTPVRRVEPARTRLNSLVIVAGVIVLLFAVFGVASAGKFVADKMSSSKTATPTPTGSGGVSAEVTRAHAQATAIVKAAQASERAILSQANTKAHRAATQIIAKARKSAAAAATSVPSGSTTAPVVVQPTVAPSTGLSTTSPAAPVPGLRGTPVGAPNLAGIPASWLVVGYNPTFGSGPGSAGSVSVVNRGNVPFHGTVKITYNHGGTATARFSRLTPGESLILPLNGPAYPGGGFVMRVIV